MTATANDVYALGLALGAILRDVEPGTRDRALDLVRKLEAQAAEPRWVTVRLGDLLSEKTLSRLVAGEDS